MVAAAGDCGPHASAWLDSLAPAAALEGSRAAFYALVAFTSVLLLSPQAWFPVLKLIRIAFLAGGIAMAAHVMERTAHKQPITPLAPEIGIALALIAVVHDHHPDVVLAGRQHPVADRSGP